MEPHLKTAQAHRFLALGYLFLTVALAAVIWWVITRSADGANKLHLFGGLATVLFAGGAFMAYHVVVVIGSKRMKPWARTMSNLMGIVMLFAFPIGTVIGGYLLWTSAEKWGEKGP